MYNKDRNPDRHDKADKWLNEMLDRGYLEMDSLGENGEVRYSVTEKGKKYLGELKRREK